MKAAGQCDIGSQREKNEDAIFLSTAPVGSLPNVFIVADGMGGHKGGEYASQFAIQYFCEYIQQSNQATTEQDILATLVQGILYANDKLYTISLSQKELQGMGTTFIVSTILNETLYIANVGDSRLYILEEEIQKITVDHSLVEEMVRKGNLSEYEAENYPNKNVITRAVGTEKTVQVDTYIIPLLTEHTILMCSDGLTNMLSDSQIKGILQSNNTLENKVNQLVDTANEKGGLDNISVILIDWKVKEVSTL
ncbi:MAG: Stp1/IreP family PP2C-type Ser/Thr phosphatase [Epulopiscium sp.]|nr:Stp1/IreP family PP2C-type Ser/Thr phosphatase [Candidatus Epulonipiscium sp.]